MRFTSQFIGVGQIIWNMHVHRQLCRSLLDRRNFSDPVGIELSPFRSQTSSLGQEAIGWYYRGEFRAAHITAFLHAHLGRNPFVYLDSHADGRTLEEMPISTYDHYLGGRI